MQARVFKIVWLLILGVSPGVFSLGTRPKRPDWIDRPSAIVEQYPAERYMVGVGICGGASPRDLSARREAENRALADLASNVEVKIQSFAEMHESEVTRGASSTLQSTHYQTTKRSVKGVLSGTEQKGSYFDSKNYTWYSLAVLEKARTGEAVLERINQYLLQGTQTLEQLTGKPLADFLALRQLEKRSHELEWFLVAATLFAPEHSTAAVRTQMRRLQEELSRQQQVLQTRLQLKLVLKTSDGQPVPRDLRQALQAALNEQGLNVSNGPGPQKLTVSLEIQSTLEKGSVVLANTICGASLALHEDEQLLCWGVLPPDARTNARFLDPAVSRQRSLERLQPLLIKSLLQTLDKQP
jgi:hypothetical protein